MQGSQDTPLAQMSSLDLLFEIHADFYNCEVSCWKQLPLEKEPLGSLAAMSLPTEFNGLVPLFSAVMGLSFS